MPDRVTYVGHSTVLIEIGGRRLLTDPLLGRRVAHLRRHGTPADPAVAQDLDAVLLSHLHHDHLDRSSLRRIARDTPVILPAGAGRYVRRLGFARVTELKAGESTTVGGLPVAATLAVHDGRRHPRARWAEAIGFMVGGAVTGATGAATTATPRVYFAGDTDLFDGMEELAGADLALVPVWGWGPNLGADHLDPRRAAEALAMLAPRVAVPIHWGTFFPHGLARLLGRVLREPPLEFARHAGDLAPRVRVEVLQPGEALDLEAEAEA